MWLTVGLVLALSMDYLARLVAQSDREFAAHERRCSSPAADGPVSAVFVARFEGQSVEWREAA